MAELARMRFKSMQSPDESGALVLTDDGAFRIEPSDEFRDEMARLEEVALRRSQTFGIGLGSTLIAVGAVALGLGWIAGRIFGKLGSTLSKPVPLSDVEIGRDQAGGIAIRLSGLEHRFHSVQMSWRGDEVLPCEADEFFAKYQELKQSK